MPVVACPSFRFEPEAALRLIAERGITTAFLPPTALRMLRGVPDPRGRFALARLRNIASAGEALGPETFEWARGALGLTIGEAYGQTECKPRARRLSGRRRGAGRLHGASRARAPGRDPASRWQRGRHRRARRDRDRPARPGDVPGVLESARSDGKKILRRLDAHRRHRAAGRDGYVHFVGREDDLITSAAYRIGPAEIEDCLGSHPAVALAAAVGKPDALRTEIVKAYIVLREGFAPSDALAAEIQAFVRVRLSAHEYPREIAFRESLPMTTTGKIIRRQLRAEG